ncbi:unnamed protein product, partial [Musa textilis]
TTRISNLARPESGRTCGVEPSGRPERKGDDIAHRAM